MVVQRSDAWRSALVAAHPDLFTQEFQGRIVTPGLPEVDDGWRDVVERAIARIAKAVEGAPSGSLKIEQIKSKFATLRLYWRYCGLPPEAIAAVGEAVALAEARSACTCETCGEEGRLFTDGGWFLTACDLHRRGKLVEAHPGRERLHVVRTRRGDVTEVSCRRYDRDADCFIDVDPSTVDFNEE